VVGRSEGQAGPLLAALADAGIDTAFVPAIEIVAVEGLEHELHTVPAATRVALTSANAAGPLLDALAAARIDPTSLRWAAVGEATAARLRAAGIADVFVPSRPDAATLAAELPLEPAEAVLLPRSDIADPEVVDALRARGADVRELIAYRTIEAPEESQARLAATLDEGPVDALVVTSGSTARGFAALAGAARDRVLAIPVVAAGTKAADAAREAGFATVVTAPAPDVASLAAFTARALGVTPATPLDTGVAS
jgi:uroporphyrinogen-III synthase